MKTRSTTIALLTVLTLAPACGKQDAPPPVETIAYLPDGSLVAFMATGIHVFGTSLDRETRTILFNGLPVAGPPESNRYNLSADGRVAAVSFPAPWASTSPGTSTIALFDMTTGARLQTLHPDDAVPFGYAQGVIELALSTTADLVVSRSLDPTSTDVPSRLTMFDAASGSPLWSRGDPWRLPVFSRDGTLLFVENTKAVRIDALDPRTSVLVYSVDLPSYPHKLAFTGDGKLAASLGPPIDQPCPTESSCANLYAFWSPVDGALLDQRSGVPGTSLHGTNPNGDASFWCSPWDDLCATDIVDFRDPLAPQIPVLNIWRTEGTPVQAVPQPYPDGAPDAVAFSPDGRFFATRGFAGSGGPVRVFRIEDGTLIGALDFHRDFL